VTGEVVGEYKVNNRESLYVVYYFAPAPAATKGDDSPKPPSSDSTQATPRYDKLCGNISL
jgi:hypothetical protein